MHKLLKAIEKLVDRAIPLLVVILAVVIILEFTSDIKRLEPGITYLDYLIIAFFVVDLAFKWHRTKNILKFIRFYWIDILAVFPFYLMFRVYSSAAELLRIGEEISESQKFAHEAVLLREAKVAREVSLLEKEAKPLVRMLRFFQRFLRVLRGRFYLAHKSMVKVSRENKKRKF